MEQWSLEESFFFILDSGLVMGYPMVDATDAFRGDVMTTKELIEKLLEYRSLNDRQITYQLPYRLIRGIIDTLEELEELRNLRSRIIKDWLVFTEGG